MEQEKIYELLHLLNDYQKWFENRYGKDANYIIEKEAYRIVKNNIVVDYLYFEGEQCVKDQEEH